MPTDTSSYLFDCCTRDVLKVLQQSWQKLTGEQRKAVRQRVRKHEPELMADPLQFHYACLLELETLLTTAQQQDDQG